MHPEHLLGRAPEVLDIRVVRHAIPQARIPIPDHRRQRVQDRADIGPRDRQGEAARRQLVPRQQPRRATRWREKGDMPSDRPSGGANQPSGGGRGLIFSCVLDRADRRGPTPRPHRSSMPTSTERVAAARMPAPDHPASPRAAAGAHPPADRPLLEELARLRKTVVQQAHSLAVMAEAISTLRDGSQALRQENRELRLELQSTRRSSATTDRSKGRARDRQHEPAAPGPPEGALHRRAETARRELRAPRHQVRS